MKGPVWRKLHLECECGRGWCLVPSSDEEAEAINVLLKHNAETPWFRSEVMDRRTVEQRKADRLRHDRTTDLLEFVFLMILVGCILAAIVAWVYVRFVMS